MNELPISRPQMREQNRKCLAEVYAHIPNPERWLSDAEARQILADAEVAR